MTVTTTASPQEIVLALPETAKRAFAIRLLSQFDSDAILALLREVRPAEPGSDYEDPGPLTEEELLQCAEARFLEYDQAEEPRP